MNLCDVNVWLSLTLSDHVHHRAARRWFDEVEGEGTVSFCRPTQQALLRLLTNASVLAPYGNPPLTNAEAWAVYQELLADDRVIMRTDEPAGLEPRWVGLVPKDTATPKLWMDAYLAAFAGAAGFHLVTTDRAFRQFSGLDLLVLE